jgi:NAD-dependent DNA ligase
MPPNRRRLVDVNGIGRQLANRLSQQGLSVYDAWELSEEQLQTYQGIGPQLASQIKQEVGEKNENRTTGSVSAEGIRTAVGDFKVELGDQDRAEARDTKHERTDKARRIDQQQRAPITLDVEKWINNKDRFDYPGVDTPTGQPDAKKKDLPFIDADDLVADERDRLF